MAIEAGDLPDPGSNGNVLPLFKNLRKEMEEKKATAIGTGINTSEYYFDNIVPVLAKICAYPLVQVDDLFDATKILMDL